MARDRRRRQLLGTLTLLAATTGFDRVASGDGAVAADCASAFSAGPDRVKQGRLLDGRSELRRCAASTCPVAMSALCADDLRRLEARIPSVVFAATDERGQDLTSVRVSEDGKVLSERIDGRAVELDPGPHRLRFDFAPSSAATSSTPSFATVSIVVREGEKSRVVYGRMGSQSPSPLAPSPLVGPSTETRPVPWQVFLSGGLTLAAATAYASFGILGLEERGSLASCKGSCEPGAVDTAWNHLRVADGFLAATVVGAAVTAVLFVTRPKATSLPVSVGSGGAAWTGRF